MTINYSFYVKEGSYNNEEEEDIPCFYALSDDFRPFMIKRSEDHKRKIKEHVEHELGVNIFRDYYYSKGRKINMFGETRAITNKELYIDNIL